MQTNRGFSLIEVLLAGTLFALFALGFLLSLSYSQESVQLSGNRVRASQLAEEGIEALRVVRDTNAQNGTYALPSGVYGIHPVGSRWSLSGSSDTIGIYTRTLTLSSADGQTSVVSTVTWPANNQRNGSLSLVTQFTNWKQPPQTVVTPSPTCTLSASPTSINQGASSLLSWATTYANSVSIAPSIGTVSTSGTQTVSPSATTEYVLTAQSTSATTVCRSTVTVIPTPVNQPPNAVNDAYTVEVPRSMRTTSDTLFVLLNDTDPDGDSITIQSVTTPTNRATAVIQGGNRIILSNIGFGVTTFSYTINDGRGGTDTATVTYTKNRACVQRFCFF